MKGGTKKGEITEKKAKCRLHCMLPFELLSPIPVGMGGAGGVFVRTKEISSNKR